MKNRAGYAVWLLLMALPVLFVTLAFLGRMLPELARQEEFRHLCLSESLGLQKRLLATETPGSAQYFSALNTGSAEILQKLRKIAPGRTQSLFSEAAASPARATLAFRLQSEFDCGAKIEKQDGAWTCKIIYKNKMDRY